MRGICSREFVTKDLDKALSKNSNRDLSDIYREMDRQNGFGDFLEEDKRRSLDDEVWGCDDFDDDDDWDY